jgi:hypothetical protein
MDSTVIALCASILSRGFYLVQGESLDGEFNSYLQRRLDPGPIALVAGHLRSVEMARGGKRRHPRDLFYPAGVWTNYKRYLFDALGNAD